MKRHISAGLYCSVIAIIAAVVGLVEYFVNAGTNYFKSMGTNPVVIATLIIAIVLLVCNVVVGMKSTPKWLDILPVASVIFANVAVANFISNRVNAIAAIITFENNASNMADLQSAIVGIAAMIVAILLTIIAAFFDVSKEATVVVETE